MKHLASILVAAFLTVGNTAFAWEVTSWSDDVLTVSHAEEGVFLTLYQYVDDKADEGIIVSTNADVSLSVSCSAASEGQSFSPSKLKISLPLEAEFLKFAKANAQNITVIFAANGVRPHQILLDLEAANDGFMAFQNEMAPMHGQERERFQEYITSYTSVFQEVVRQARGPITVILEANERGRGFWRGRTVPAKKIMLFFMLSDKGSTAVAKEISDKCGKAMYPVPAGVSYSRLRDLDDYRAYDLVRLSFENEKEKSALGSCFHGRGQRALEIHQDNGFSVPTVGAHCSMLTNEIFRREGAHGLSYFLKNDPIVVEDLLALSFLTQLQVDRSQPSPAGTINGHDIPATEERVAQAAAAFAAKHKGNPLLCEALDGIVKQFLVRYDPSFAAYKGKPVSAIPNILFPEEYYPALEDSEDQLGKCYLNGQTENPFLCGLAAEAELLEFIGELEGMPVKALPASCKPQM